MANDPVDGFRFLDKRDNRHPATTHGISSRPVAVCRNFTRVLTAERQSQLRSSRLKRKNKRSILRLEVAVGSAKKYLQRIPIAFRTRHKTARFRNFPFHISDISKALSSFSGFVPTVYPFADFFEKLHEFIHIKFSLYFRQERRIFF